MLAGDDYSILGEELRGKIQKKKINEKKES
jgi:hypothetical protein